MIFPANLTQYVMNFADHHADLCEDVNRQNHHPRGGAFWYHRECQGQDTDKEGMYIYV